MALRLTARHAVHEQLRDKGQVSEEAQYKVQVNTNKCELCFHILLPSSDQLVTGIKRLSCVEIFFLKDISQMFCYFLTYFVTRRCLFYNYSLQGTDN